VLERYARSGPVGTVEQVIEKLKEIEGSRSSASSV